MRACGPKMVALKALNYCVATTYQHLLQHKYHLVGLKLKVGKLLSLPYSMLNYIILSLYESMSNGVMSCDDPYFGNKRMKGFLVFLSHSRRICLNILAVLQAMMPATVRMTPILQPSPQIFQIKCSRAFSPL